MAAPKGNKYGLFNNGGRPSIYDTPEDIIVKIEEYFLMYVNLDEENENRLGYKPTLVGLAIFLGFASKQSLYDYMKKEEFSYPIKKAISMIEMDYEQLLESKSSTGAIFALKNMGWSDKQEIEQKTINYNASVTKEEAKEISDALENEC